MDYKRLNEIVKNSQIPMVKIAAELGISVPTLYSKLKGESDFRITEASKLKNLLQLSKPDFYEIFFDSNLNKSQV